MGDHMFAELRVVSDRSALLPEKLHASAWAAIKDTAKAIKEGAARRARKDTEKMSRALAVDNDREGLLAEVGPDGSKKHGFLWRFHEFGTVKMPAHPALGPAAESERGDHRARMVRAINEATE